MQDEDGFYHVNSHMMRKFSQHPLINAGMPEEILEHIVGHKLKDRLSEAYFLADSDELRKIYLRSVCEKFSCKVYTG
ncbi:integrase/recombinase [Methanobacterium petrolearium]|nr:integrase/recombinase [Methanobacterium petrolearium]BDZ71009.1 hypothetical protein GCM10025861_15260 [Methanobacterium petrolearium]